jgi:ribosomal protein S18 acetylase RimI-like enzyme
MTAVSRSTNTLRPANAADADALARLHADRISEGFLPTLGHRFLARLYRRMARSNRATAYVVTEDGRIVAFAAGTTSVGAFYKEFLVHDGVPAALLAAPHAPRAWRHVLETMRYPSTTADLPAAEVLAVATASDAGGRGYASRTVQAVTADLARRGCDAAKVTVGDGNEQAIRMYCGCGFEVVGEIAVHAERRSQVLTWTAS